VDVPARIEIEDGERVVLAWEDGATTVLTARRLREACACATCREPSGEAATRAVLAGGSPIRIADAQLVGAYALNFSFEPDGHHTGIYPFDVLRTLEQEA
jgi:DUF971 family protein